MVKIFLLRIQKIKATRRCSFCPVYVEPILLRDKNATAECVQSLAKEYKNYCFNLDDPNCNPRYVGYSLNQYKNTKIIN